MVCCLITAGRACQCIAARECVAAFSHRPIPSQSQGKGSLLCPLIPYRTPRNKGGAGAFYSAMSLALFCAIQQDVYADAYQQMAALPGLKPLGVGEMSCAEFEDYDKVGTVDLTRMRTNRVALRYPVSVD